MCVQLGFLVLQMITKEGKISNSIFVNRQMYSPNVVELNCGTNRGISVIVVIVAHLYFGSDQNKFSHFLFAVHFVVVFSHMESHTEHTYSHRFRTRNESLCIFMCTCRTSQFTYAGERSDKDFFAPNFSKHHRDAFEGKDEPKSDSIKCKNYTVCIERCITFCRRIM